MERERLQLEVAAIAADGQARAADESRAVALQQGMAEAEKARAAAEAHAAALQQGLAEAEEARAAAEAKAAWVRPPTHSASFPHTRTLLCHGAEMPLPLPKAAWPPALPPAPGWLPAEH